MCSLKTLSAGCVQGKMYRGAKRLNKYFIYDWLLSDIVVWPPYVTLVQVRYHAVT